MNNMLESVLESLWRQSRFVSYFYQSVNFVENPNIPTLVLAVQESRLVLYYSAEFIDRMTPPELIGLLVHEMLHVVLNHNHMAYPEESLYLQNLAQDMVINSYLTERRKIFFSKKESHASAAELSLPRGLPLVPHDFITETGIHDPTWDNVFQWLKRLPMRKIAEYASGPDITTGMDGRNQGSISDNIDSMFNFNPQMHEKERNMNSIQISDKKGLVFIDNLDSIIPTGVHLFYDRERLDIIDAKKSAIISMADKDRDCALERAYQEIKGIIERTRDTDITPWEHLLKSIVDYSAQSNEWTYTYGRFNRRYFTNGIYSPGRVFKEQELITVAVDVSGSMVMTPSDIEAAFGVIEQLMGKYRIHLVCLDEDLFIPEKRENTLAASNRRDKPFVYQAGDWRYIRTGSGGTTFFAPLFNRYLKGHHEMLLVITDGYIYDLDKLKRYTPTIWVISSSRQDAFHAPFGQSVKISPASELIMS
jgi:predicted metal-dependent peptidase